ncbi:O-antigen ligase domain-containing protein [Pontibacter diazotrophicus]|uniref:O-antigen ligase domain-containing protein n=1 Tax=Pontibacter diazotrophicus TaxID=1400979 RepID=A0A3D8L146_9BACT|nr:O-antigen ligase family protein [Pontibacter diazotrophicus]RDV11096.1 O-antigen ligase domain-containing protein [Pontibacter diazotrophicus]
MKRINICSILLLLVFILHFTIIQAFVPDVTVLYYAVLFSCLSLVLYKNKKVKILFPLLLVSGASLVFSTGLLPGAFFRWVSWIVLILVAAPVLLNSNIILFRNKLWWYKMYLFVFITVVSFVWIIFRLPNYGVSELYTGDGKYFRSGVTQHEMILSPIASIVCIFAIYNLCYKANSRLLHFAYSLLFLISVVTVFMASSRTSIAGLLFVLLFIFFSKFKILIKTIIRRFVPFMLIVLFFITPTLILVSYEADNFIVNNTRLENKGTNNSREELWNARIEDFKLNPITGAGFHSVSKEVIQKYNSGANKETGSVEFGSFYLEALSTMGALGFGALLYLLLKVVFIGLRHFDVQDGRLYFFVFVFMLFHFFAEAHAFAAGSVLCLFTWLSISQVYNLRLQK